MTLERQQKPNNQGGVTIYYSNSHIDKAPATISLYPRKEFLKSIPPSTKEIQVTIKPNKEILNREGEDSW